MEEVWAAELLAPVVIVGAPVARLAVAGPLVVGGFRVLRAAAQATVGQAHSPAGN